MNELMTMENENGTFHTTTYYFSVEIQIIN